MLLRHKPLEELHGVSAELFLIACKYFSWIYILSLLREIDRIQSGYSDTQVDFERVSQDFGEVYVVIKEVVKEFSKLYLSIRHRVIEHRSLIFNVLAAQNMSLNSESLKAIKH